MKNNMVGNKLTNDKENTLKQISKYEKELEKAIEFKKEYPCYRCLRSAG